MSLKIPFCQIAYNILSIVFIINSALSKRDSNTKPLINEKYFNKNKLDKSEKRIVGGHPATIGQYPYQISLQYKGVEGLNICGGSILNKKVVITAAHCIYGHRSEEVFIVVAGISSLNNMAKGECYEIDNHFVHPEWDPAKLSNDLALLIINSVFKFNRNIQPIKYATKPVQLMRCVTTGWGADETEGKHYPEQLYALILEIQNNERCSSDFPNDYNNGSEICAGGLPGKDTCNGDSGGPLVCNNLLYGITSYGTRECAVGAVGVFVNVYHYRKWLKKELEPYNASGIEFSLCFLLCKKWFLIIVWLELLEKMIG